MTTVEQHAGSAIRSFQVAFAEEALDDLRRRLAATRWPSRELVDDRSQGVQLATMQALCRYWASEYDMRRAEARLNGLPQFTTEIDGVDIHFVHVRSRHEDALPLIMTHGWPGSVIELLGLGRPADGSDRARGQCRGRLPPGAAVTSRLWVLRGADRGGLGPRPRRSGVGGADAPPRLHPLRRTGRRRGRRRHRRDGPPGARGSAGHPHQPAGDGARRPGVPPGGHRRRSAPRSRRSRPFQASGNGYFVEQATRPQTIGYALLDSPVALAAWMIDHDTDAYYKITAAFVDGQPSGNLTRDNLLDNITTYWLTGTGAARGPVVLGGLRARRACGGPSGSPAATDPGRLHHIPGRDLADPSQLGREVLPHPHLLLGGGEGRPLRRLGGAGALRGRTPRRVPRAAHTQGARSSPMTVRVVPGREENRRSVRTSPQGRLLLPEHSPEHFSAVASRVGGHRADRL